MNRREFVRLGAWSAPVVLTVRPGRASGTPAPTSDIATPVTVDNPQPVQHGTLPMTGIDAAKVTSYGLALLAAGGALQWMAKQPRA